MWNGGPSAAAPRTATGARTSITSRLSSSAVSADIIDASAPESSRHILILGALPSCWKRTAGFSAGRDCGYGL
jgi:hypothetical protein